METDLSWCDALRYAAGPGVSVIVGFVLSELVRYVPGFESLTAKAKRVAFAGVCLVVPVVASGLGVLTCDWPFSWSATFWSAVLAGRAAFFSWRRILPFPRADAIITKVVWLAIGAEKEA